jgi:short-chain fatty acids transporter
MTTDLAVPDGKSVARESLWERFGHGLAAWSERWFPDPLAFALVGILLVFVCGLLLGESPRKLAVAGGASFWALAPFTIQMAMTIIGGYVVASAPPVSGLIRKLALLPRTGKGAVAFVAVFSMGTALVSWGFSLIFSGLLVRALARRVKDMDYRAAGAASYLGLGPIWALGLSSSSALMMATKSSIPPGLFEIAGSIPLTQTLFTWPTAVMAMALIVLSTAVAYWSAPSPDRARTAADFGVPIEAPDDRLEPRMRPGEWLEYSPILSVSIAALLAYYLFEIVRKAPSGIWAALDLNNYNLILIVIGMLLHWRPKPFVRSVNKSVPSTSGVLIQFPFYAVIFGMIVGTSISATLSRLFVRVTTRGTFPVLVAAYSATLGVFIPSGGSKWIIEAPYVLSAAAEHRVNLGWVVQIYNASEALPNMLNPFWMLPLLGILRLKARNLVGYSMLQMMVQAPVVVLLCWYFARIIPFVPPAR